MRTVVCLLLLALVGCGRTEALVPRPPPDAGPPLVPDRDPRPDAGIIIIDGGIPDSGLVFVPCNVDSPCPSGFFCQNGACALDGSSGELQITLNWSHDPRLPEDLDLHVVEPSALNTGCEVFWEFSNTDGSPSDCGAVGSLDLDANAGCHDTSVEGLGADTENIIYPPGVTPPPGHYVVRVDYYELCSGSGDIPYTVTVRKGSHSTTYSGSFGNASYDNGAAGSGVVVAEFDEP